MPGSVVREVEVPIEERGGGKFWYLCFPPISFPSKPLGWLSGLKPDTARPFWRFCATWSGEDDENKADWWRWGWGWRWWGWGWGWYWPPHSPPPPALTSADSWPCSSGIPPPPLAHLTLDPSKDFAALAPRQGLCNWKDQMSADLMQIGKLENIYLDGKGKKCTQWLQSRLQHECTLCRRWQRQRCRSGPLCSSSRWHHGRCSPL